MNVMKAAVDAAYERGRREERAIIAELPKGDKLVDEALKHAAILHASASWGTSWGGHLIESLVRRIVEK